MNSGCRIFVVPDQSDSKRSRAAAAYPNALSHLQGATSSRDSARAFAEAAQKAPAQTRAMREKMEESQAVAPDHADVRCGELLAHDPLGTSVQ